MQPFESDGAFWLPRDEERRLTGRVKFDPAEGATLSLWGAFDDSRAQVSENAPALRIHGVAGKRHLTLDGCFNTETTHEWPGIKRQNFYVARIISGALFDEGEELTFDEVSVTLDQLPMWIHRPGVYISLHESEEEKIAHGVTIDFDRPQDETVQSGDCQLSLTSTWSFGGDHITDTHLTQGTHLRIKYPDTRRLDSILDDVKGLQDLVTLAIDVPAVPTDITLWREDIAREIEPGRRRIPQSMSFHAAQIAERVRLKQPQPPSKMLFRFQDIGGLETICHWVKVARDYHTILGSLLSIRYASGLYVENRYHNVVSAAESFHRLRFSNEVMHEDDFKRLLHEIITAVPKKHRSWLNNQLQYSNEPRLGERLKELVRHCAGAFSAIYGDTSKWITVVTESRNRLTHHDKTREITFDRGDLLYLAESVFVLVMLCLFRECGVEQDTLDGIGNSGRVQFLQRQLTEIVPRLHAAIVEIRKKKKGKRPTHVSEATVSKPEPQLYQ